mgnify:CR=1 FL=1
MQQGYSLPFRAVSRRVSPGFHCAVFFVFVARVNRECVFITDRGPCHEPMTEAFIWHVGAGVSADSVLERVSRRVQHTHCTRSECDGHSSPRAPRSRLLDASATSAHMFKQRRGREQRRPTCIRRFRRGRRGALLHRTRLHAPRHSSLFLPQPLR